MIGSGRIVPPALPRWYIDSSRLERLRAEIPQHRLTTVVAGAGYGKSSFLAGSAAAWGAAWLTIERSDRSLASIVPAIVAALRRRIPDLPVEPALELGGASEAESVERAQSIAAELVDAIDGATSGEVALVFDDVHRLDPNTPGAQLVQALVLQAPARLHFVLAGRERPPFALERLRGQGEVLTIGAGDLALTADEIDRMVDELIPSHEPQLSAQLHALTNGWPAAVRIAIEAIRRGATPRWPGVEEPAPVDAELFDYLAEEVFTAESPEVVAFVQAMSIFPRFTIPMAEAVGMANARPLVQELAARGMFVVAMAETDGWYALHALVRRYARARLPIDRTRRSALLRAAATWFETTGLLRDAAAALIALGRPEPAAAFTARRGRDLFTAGGAADLVRLDRILTARARTPEVDDLVGEALLVTGEMDLARQRLDRHVAGEGPIPSRPAWLLGRIHWERGELAEAKSVLERARLGEDAPHDALVLSYLANVHWAIGDVAACRNAGNRALQLATSLGDDRGIAAALNPLAVLAIQTDPAAAVEQFGRGIAAARRAGDVFQLIRLATNLGTVLEAQGRYEAALEQHEESVRQAELVGWPAALAAALRVRGVTRFRLGRLDEAIADLEQARSIWERVGSSRVAWALLNLGWAHRQRGAIALSRALLERALELAGRQRDVQIQIFVRAELARIRAEESPGDARALADRSLADARRLEYAEPDARLACGWVALTAGDEAMATAHAEAAAEGGRRASEPAIVAESLELRALASHEPQRRLALLEDALALWTEFGDLPGRLRVEVAIGRLSTEPTARIRGRAAETQLRGLGVRLDAAARAPGVLSVLRTGGHGEVAIRTLGGFAVVRDGRTVEFSEWRSRKARDLLKLLVARRGHPVARDETIEALWPDEGPNRLSNRLAVAVATLRRVLDPSRRHEANRFVGGDQESLWLQLGAATVDVEAFLADAAAALGAAGRSLDDEAVELLELAEAAYGGDFLEEDPYADWGTALREQARAAYIGVLRALATAAEGRGDVEAATRSALRILERDPYDEEAHLRLVAALERAHRRGEARRRYRVYVAAMRELGVEAVPFPVG